MNVSIVSVGNEKKAGLNLIADRLGRSIEIDLDLDPGGLLKIREGMVTRNLKLTVRVGKELHCSCLTSCIVIK